MYGVSIDRVGFAGRLAMLWRKDVCADILSYSSNHIDVMVQLP